MDEEDRRSLESQGIKLLEEPVKQVSWDGGRIVAMRFASGRQEAFDVLYSALGAKVRSDLVVSLGASADADGALMTDAHQRTSVPGIWAAGDVVSGLNQIAVAFGQAAIAATDIHHQLSSER